MGIYWFSAFLALSLALPTPLREHRVRSLQSPLKVTAGKATPPRVAFVEARKVGSVRKKDSSDALTPIHLNQVIAQKQLRALKLVRAQRRVQVPLLVIRKDSPVGTISSASTLKKYPSPHQSGNLESSFHEASAIPTEPRTEWDSSEWTPRQRDWLRQSGVSPADFAALPTEPAAEVDPVRLRLRQLIEQETGAPLPPTTWTTTSNPTAAEPAPRQSENPVVEEGPSLGQTVTGRISLAPGLIMGSGDHIEVRWVREGAPQTLGVIDTEKDFKYSVRVDQPVGSVVADLVDSRGYRKGRGALRLGPQVAGGDLVIRSERAFASRPSNFYHSTNRLMGYAPLNTKKTGPKVKARTRLSMEPSNELTMDDVRPLRLDGVLPGSSTFAITEGEGFSPSVQLLRAGADQNLPMLPERTMSALRELTQQVQKDRGYLRAPTFLLGQVTHQGQPAAGMTVEIIQEPEAHVVYLNALLIPDPQLEQTSGSGYFVLVGLEEGYYSLKAFNKGLFAGFGNVKIVDGATSILEIQALIDRKPWDARVFDAFQGTGLSADLDSQAFEGVLTVSEQATFNHPVTESLVLAKLTPKDSSFLPTLVHYSGKEDHLHAPLVKEAWLQGLANLVGAQHKVVLRGALIGFVNQGGYHLQIPTSDSAGVSIVFFDGAGQQTQGPVEGGGFAVFGLSAGAHNVVLYNALGETASQVVPVSEDVLSTVKFVF